MPNLTSTQTTDLLKLLQERFNQNKSRHPDLDWADIETKLISDPSKLKIIHWMEETAGEPDVVHLDINSDQLTFVDCSPQTPKGRRSLCYDQVALESRKTFKPTNSAINLAQQVGVEILDESQYRKLQEFGDFDTKTSSWIKTPNHIRDLGGALFCDKRYNSVFVYHNGADSYYASRAFRCYLQI